MQFKFFACVYFHASLDSGGEQRKKSFQEKVTFLKLLFNITQLILLSLKSLGQIFPVIDNKLLSIK